MSGEKSGKTSLGVILLSLFFLLFGALETSVGLLNLRIEIFYSSFLVSEGVFLILISFGLFDLKLWSWYLAVGVSIVGFFRYFAIPQSIGHIPLDLILFPYVIWYLFYRRDLFFKKTTFRIKNWMKENIYVVLAVVIWVSILFALRPFGTENYTIALNDDVSHQTGENRPISMVATALKQPDEDPQKDYYVLEIRIHSDKPMDAINLAIFSEQAFCDMWQPASAWPSLQNQMMSIRVTGGWPTHQINWAVSSSNIFDYDFVANFWVSNEGSFDWQAQANAQKLMSIWWIGLDAGSLAIIITWSAIRSKKK